MSPFASIGHYKEQYGEQINTQQGLLNNLFDFKRLVQVMLYVQLLTFIYTLSAIFYSNIACKQIKNWCLTKVKILIQMAIEKFKSFANFEY